MSSGVVRFIGIHKSDPSKGMRILVQLDDAVGKNNGTIGGIAFTASPLPAKTGVLVRPGKVTAILYSDHESDSSGTQSEDDEDLSDSQASQESV